MWKADGFQLNKTTEKTREPPVCKNIGFASEAKSKEILLCTGPYAGVDYNLTYRVRAVLTPVFWYKYKPS